MYSALVRCYSQKEKNTTRACEDTEKGNEKIQIDGQEKGRNFSWGKTGKKKGRATRRERDLERRVIHFDGSKTHYLLIRAHTFFSV